MKIKSRFWLLLLFIAVVSQGVCQTTEDKIDTAIMDEKMSLRGKIAKEDNTFTLFYFDAFEKDSHTDFLQKKGYHGGGPSWLAMLYTIFNDYETNIIDELKYEVQASGVTFKGTHKEDLLMVSRVIALLKSDEKVMIDVIEKAKSIEIMK